MDKAGLGQPAHTVAGRLEQARRWLEQPEADDRGLGRQAIALVVQEGQKVGESPFATKIMVTVIGQTKDKLHCMGFVPSQ